jgi:hypothetical protein
MKIAFTGGNENDSPFVEIVHSSYRNKNKGDMSVRITTKESIEISFETLKNIVQWLKENESQLPLGLKLK